MAMCASDKERKKAEGDCPPKKVAKEYASADQRKTKKKTVKGKHGKKFTMRSQ